MTLKYETEINPQGLSGNKVTAVSILHNAITTFQIYEDASGKLWIYLKKNDVTIHVTLDEMFDAVLLRER